jgi:hypothetical protein
MYSLRRSGAIDPAPTAPEQTASSTARDLWSVRVVVTCETGPRRC